MIESEKFTKARRAATKTYQTAVKQRAEALQKHAISKAEQLELIDPHVPQAYDLWNTQDEKKGSKPD